MAVNVPFFCRWRICLAASALVAGITVPTLAPAFADEESAEQRRARLEVMSAEQKESIRKKRERFESLPKEEQDRLRKLYDEIEAHPQCERLKKVMVNYHEWLKTLPAKDQADLLSVPPEKRLAKIKEIQTRLAGERLAAIASELHSEDVSAISTWLEMYVSSHEKEFTNTTPPQFKSGLEKLPKVERIRRHVWGIGWRLENNPDTLPTPTDDELATFVSLVSPQARKILEKAISPEEKWQDAQEFIRQVQISKRMPRVSDEELRKFAATLTPDQLDELESKSPEDMKRDLRRMYQWQKAGYAPPGGFNPWDGGGLRPPRNFKGGRGPKPGEERPGPPPPGEGPRPPREEQPPKEEDAKPARSAMGKNNLAQPLR